MPQKGVSQMAVPTLQYQVMLQAWVLKPQPETLLQMENFYVAEIAPVPTHFSIAPSDQPGSYLFEKSTDRQKKPNLLCCDFNQI